MTLAQLQSDTLIPLADLSDRVLFSRVVSGGGFDGVIAVLEQKSGIDYQYLFPIDEYDVEFLQGLKEGDRLVRITTPMSSPDHLFHRSIAKVNVKLGTIAFVDDADYSSLGLVVWERSIKVKFINIAEGAMDYFGASRN